MLKRRIINNTEGDLEVPNFFEQSRSDVEQEPDDSVMPDDLDKPESPEICLLYTSPSPRDS